MAITNDSHQTHLELKNIRDLMEAHERMDVLRHQSEKEARDLAAVDINRRLAEMNQFREQIAKERGMFVLRDLHDALERSLVVKVDKLETDFNGELNKRAALVDDRLNKISQSADDRLKALEIMRSNLEGKIWMMGAIITALLGGLQLLFKAMK